MINKNNKTLPIEVFESCSYSTSMIKFWTWWFDLFNINHSIINFTLFQKFERTSHWVDKHDLYDE